MREPPRLQLKKRWGKSEPRAADSYQVSIGAGQNPIYDSRLKIDLNRAGDEVVVVSAVKKYVWSIARSARDCKVFQHAVRADPVL